tara:strand:+ start:150 stop:503 length:354 start_codon:yes stop_codon:yes gene_type:complete
MFNLWLSIIVCILVVILFFAFKKLEIKAFSPMNVNINLLSLNKNILKFEATNKYRDFSGVYELEIPNNIVINEKDKVSIGYHMNLGKIVKMTELKVNDKVVLEESDCQKLSLKMLLN